MRQYIELVEDVINLGEEKHGRNGSTISRFGMHYEHDLADGYPLLTTKKVFFRAVIEELLWFISGNPSALPLQAKGITIWDEWMDEEGNVPSPYGYFWRNWGEHRVDQLNLILNELRTNPHSRRMVLTAWDPTNAWVSKLPPCHVMAIFNVQADGRLNCHLTQRSGDIALGVPFNLASYAALTHLLAYHAGMKPGIFSHTIVDAHIYTHHLPGLKQQIARRPRDLPWLEIRENGEKFEDFVLTGYAPHPAIFFEVVP